MDSGNFRLKISQFLFASFLRVGYKVAKSIDVDSKINDGIIVHLCQKGGIKGEQTFVHSFLPNEKILAISCITPSLGSDGRPTSQNRTILIDTRDLEEIVKSFLTAEVPISLPKQLDEIAINVEIIQ